MTLLSPVPAASAEALGGAAGGAPGGKGEPAAALLSEAAARQHMEGQAEQYIAECTAAVLQEAQAAGEAAIRVNAVRAMVALSAPGLGDAVVGTAAAIVAEVAAAGCARALLAGVPSAVRQAVTRHVEALLAALRKARRPPREGDAGGREVAPALAVAATAPP